MTRATGKGLLAVLLIGMAPVAAADVVKLTDGRIDLKLGGIMPIFSTARVVALAHGIDARNTPLRLEAAKALDLVSPETIDNLIEAHRVLLTQILKQHLPLKKQVSR